MNPKSSLEIRLLLFFAMIFSLTAACGGSDHAQTSQTVDVDTGDLAVNVVLKGAADAGSADRTKNFSSCDDIDSVKITVLNDGNLTIAEQTWPCSEHGGTFTSIPRGFVSVVIEGLHQTGTDAFIPYYRGRESDIYIDAGDKKTVSIEAFLTDEAPIDDVDLDGDHYTFNEGDCNDGNNTIYPGAEEICNGVDDDCDGDVDEGVKNTYYLDNDGDRFGDAGQTTQACSAPDGYVADHTDCDDSSDAINPDASEVCGDGVDQDCDPTTCPLNPVVSVSHAAAGTIPSGGSYDFGPINIYESAETTFTIHNNGEADLVLSGIALTSGDTDAFSVDAASLPVTVPMGGSMTFTAFGNPISGGDKASTVRITSNADAFEFDLELSVIEFHGITTLDSVYDVGQHSSITVDDGRIFIGYYDASNRKLKIQRSLNDGIDWTALAVTNTSDMGQGVSIAIDGDKVFVSTSFYGNSPIVLVKSDDNGDAWNASEIVLDGTTLSNAGSDEYFTSIALDGQYVYVTYLDDSNLKMRVCKSTYDAVTWSYSEIDSPPGIGDETGYYSSLAVENNTLYISHSGYMTGHLFFTRMSNAMDDPVSITVDEISDDDYKGRGYTSLALAKAGSNTHVYLAYYDQFNGNQDLKFANSINNGASFSNKTIDSSSEDVGRYPSIATSGGRIYISYYDQDKGLLKFAVSEDQGTTWQTKIVDEDSSPDDIGQFSSLAADGDKVYISYYDASNGNLKFAKSLDGGNTWD